MAESILKHQDFLYSKYYQNTPSDTINHIYSTDVSVNDYFCIGAFTPFDSNVEVRLSNLERGFYRYTLWDTVSNTQVVGNAAYTVYFAFLRRSGLAELT